MRLYGDKNANGPRGKKRPGRHYTAQYRIFVRNLSKTALIGSPFVLKRINWSDSGGAWEAAGPASRALARRPVFGVVGALIFWLVATFAGAKIFSAQAGTDYDHATGAHFTCGDGAVSRRGF